MDEKEWAELKQAVKAIYESIVGTTDKVGLIEWQRNQDVKITDLQTRITRLEDAKESAIKTVVRQLFLAAWAAILGAMTAKFGGGH